MLLVFWPEHDSLWPAYLLGESMLGASLFFAEVHATEHIRPAPWLHDRDLVWLSLVIHIRRNMTWTLSWCRAWNGLFFCSMAYTSYPA